ncbi:hypothetical protein PMAYCL1PPCAC_02650, partial [Pristionchus mayeri]
LHSLLSSSPIVSGSPPSPSYTMSQVETNDVSTAHSEQFEEYQSMLDAQRRLDGIELEVNDGIESLVEMTALEDDISMVSTGYEASETACFYSSDEVTDSMSIYSDHDDDAIEVECPTFFPISFFGQAVAMDSIEALDQLADFKPIPVDFTDFIFESLALPHLKKDSLLSVAEYTAHAGDTESCTTCPHDYLHKDAAITDPKEKTKKVDLTSYSIAPSETYVVVDANEGLIKTNDISSFAVESIERLVEMSEVAKSPLDGDLTVYPREKSECEVDISEVTPSYSEYSIQPSELGIEMIDSHSSYTEGPFEIECNL